MYAELTSDTKTAKPAVNIVKGGPLYTVDRVRRSECKESLRCVQLGKFGGLSKSLSVLTLKHAGGISYKPLSNGWSGDMPTDTHPSSALDLLQVHVFIKDKMVSHPCQSVEAMRRIMVH